MNVIRSARPGASMTAAIVLLAALLLPGVTASASPAVGPASGTATSVAAVSGKGQGSNTWGFVGDVQTASGTNDPTFSYGVAISPTDGSLWVTDSGKVVYNATLCRLLGYPSSPCQTGTPSVGHYPAAGAVSTDYLGNGGFNPTSYTASPGVNAGVGARFAPLANSQQKTYPASEALVHGPRGVVIDNSGTAWIADSEATSPIPAGTDLSAPLPPTAVGTGAIKRFSAGFAELPGAGYTGSWPQTATTGVLNYHAGVAIDSSGKIWSDNQIRDAYDLFNPDGSTNSRVRLDLPAGSFSATDPGYRNPYGIAIDKTDDSYYLPLINFRDDAGLRQTPFLEKRNAAGEVIGHFGLGQLTPGQVVFGVYVDQITRHVYTWSGSDTASSSLFEYTKDGALVRTYSSAQFPGLSSIRGITTDSRGYLYITVGQGSASTRVMILAQTPDSVTSVCAARTAAKTSVELSWDCQGPVAEGDDYSKAPVLDYVVEQREVGTDVWSVVPHPASTLQSRTISGLDSSKNYEFRVSAWNEAGNGDWAAVRADVAQAQDDSLSTDFGTAGSVDVLSNDTFELTPASGAVSLLDAAGNPATSVSIDGQGSYSVSGSIVTFTPVSGFHGSATPVKYRVRDATGCIVEASITANVAAGASLTLVKQVSGDPGAAAVSAWTLSAEATDGTKISGATGDASVTAAVLKGGEYKLSESGPAQGYSTDGFVCLVEGGDPLPASNKVTLAAGQNVVCTITNAFKALPTQTPTETVTPTQSPTETPTQTPTVTPTPSTSGPVVTTTTPGGQPTSAPSDPGQDLPNTGFGGNWVWLIFALLIAGAMLLVLSRRGRHS